MRSWRAVVALHQNRFIWVYYLIVVVLLIALNLFGGDLLSAPWAGSSLLVGVGLILAPLFLQVMYWRLFLPVRWLMLLSWERRRDPLSMACVTIFMLVWIGGGLLIGRLISPLYGLVFGAFGFAFLSIAYDSRVTLVATLNRWRDQREHR